MKGKTFYRVEMHREHGGWVTLYNRRGALNSFTSAAEARKLLTLKREWNPGREYRLVRVTEQIEVIE